MADTQEQSLSLVTLAAGDYIRVVHSPGGTPESAYITDAGLKTYLKAYNDTLYYGTANVSHNTSGFSSISDTTLNNIPGLTFTTVSGGKYRFQAMLFIINDAAGGTKVAISGTNTATDIKYRAEFLGGSYEMKGAAGLNAALGETAVHLAVRISGYIEVNAGGTLTVQAAQNASCATATIVLIGSWFEVDKIG